MAALVGQAHEPERKREHIADLRRALHELVDEAEKRVSNLEAELVEAREVLKRMRKAVEHAELPF